MTNSEKTENKEKLHDIINTTFCLPITYVDKDKLHEIDAHVMTDLELIHVQSDLDKEKKNINEKDTSVINKNHVRAYFQPQNNLWETVFRPMGEILYIGYNIFKRIANIDSKM
jgi:hypothetical protein